MSDEQKDVAPKGDPLFISTTGKPELLCLLSGHNISVSHEGDGTSLPTMFHRLAAMRGVVPVAIADAYRESNPRSNEKEGAPKRKLIREEIKKMVAEGATDMKRQVELFTNDGLPSAQQLSSRLGFHVSASERDEVWKEFDAGDEG